jgi:hypothetical protein
MTADNLRNQEETPVLLTVLRNFGTFTLEETKIAPTSGMEGRQLMFQPTLSIKAIGIKSTSPHTGGT